MSFPKYVAYTLVQAILLAGFSFAAIQLKVIPLDYAHFIFWFAYSTMLFHIAIWCRHALQFHTEHFADLQTISVCAFAPLFTYLFPTDELSTKQHLESCAVAFTVLLMWINHRFLFWTLKREPERRGLWDLSKRI